MRRTAIALLMTFLLVAPFNPAPALACTCVSPSGPVERQVADAKKDASAVFSGRVLDVRALEGEHDVEVRIAVSRIWKGTPPETAVVRTGRGGGDCGYRFTPGKDYLVYCYEGDGHRLSTNICTRTRPIKAAAEDIRYLGRATEGPAR